MLDLIPLFLKFITVMIPSLIAIHLLVVGWEPLAVIPYSIKKLKVRLNLLDTVIDFKLLNIIKFSDISAEDFRQKLCNLYADRSSRFSSFNEFIMGNSNSILVLEALTELRPEINSEDFKELEGMLVTSLSTSSQIKYKQQEQNEIDILSINKRLEGI